MVQALGAEKEWRGVDNSNEPFLVLRSMPVTIPPLLRPVFSGQNDMPLMQRSMESCMDRFTQEEKGWWRAFLSTEQSKRRMWARISEKELKEGGRLDWPLKRLKKYEEPSKRLEIEANNVSEKGMAIKEMIDKRNNFKKVSITLYFY